jgi:cysteinyl-tRNA synthetase
MIVRAKDRQTQDEHIKMLYASLTLLGFDDLSGFKNGAHVHFEHVITNDEINQAILRRNAARKAKDFKESDRIRDELLAKGIVLKDGPTGTTWEVKR